MSNKIQNVNIKIKLYLHLPFDMGNLSLFLHDFFLPLFHVFGPFFGDIDKNFKRRFNNKIQNENEKIDAGKFFIKPFANFNYRHIEKIRNKGKDVFPALDNIHFARHLPDS